MSRSAMLIASPMPRVPPVTIATRAMSCLPSYSGARLGRLQPACKFTRYQLLQHGHAFGRIVEAIEQREPVAAMRQECAAPADSELLERFQAIGGKSGGRHRDLVEAVCRKGSEGRAGRRFGPSRPPEPRLEGNVDLSPQRFRQDPPRLR